MDELSERLDASRVGCVVGDVLLNHLAYADDMVLLAPSATALQRLLSICGEYGLQHDIVYNTQKTVCMICWPQKILMKFFPRFSLQGDVLEYVTTFKYLGFLLCSDMKDDADIRRRTMNIYALGNMIIRKFKKCNVPCKSLMYKTYCSSVYCSALWDSYRVGSLSK